MATNLELFTSFARISASTFGGGYAMLPFFQRELVEKRGWLTDEELLDLNAVAQCTPGVIAVNTATFCGYRTKGLAGAVFATLGVLFPPILIVLVISSFFWGFAENPWVAHALVGVRACVCAAWRRCWTTSGSRWTSTPTSSWSSRPARTAFTAAHRSAWGT